MPRTRGDKGAPKDADTPGKGKGEQGGESSPKPPEEGGSPGSSSPGAESRHGGHGQKNSKKGAGDPHAAAAKAYSPFLNTVFGKVGAGAGGQWMEGLRGAGDRFGDAGDGGDVGHWAGATGQAWGGWGLFSLPPYMEPNGGTVGGGVLGGYKQQGWALWGSGTCSPGATQETAWSRAAPGLRQCRRTPLGAGAEGPGQGLPGWVQGKGATGATGEGGRQGFASNPSNPSCGS